MKEIRLLRAEEINVKPKQLFQSSGGVSAMLLLYKDSRCDMAILDQTFGMQGWQREHRTIGNSLFCRVSVWSDEIQQWVSKEDIGTASDIEKEKGEASDAFKRACTNWGIGRELYTSPRIYVKLEPNEYKQAGKEKPKMKSGITFAVAEIQYGESNEITYLVIMDGGGVVRHVYGDKKTHTKATKASEPDKRPPIPSECKQERTEPIPLTNMRVREVFTNCKALDTAQYVTVALGKMGMAGMKELNEHQVTEFMELTVIAKQEAEASK